MTTDNGEWLEFKPYEGQLMPPANMEPIISYIMGTGQPFEFTVASIESPRVKGEKVVRYFIKAPDRETREALQGHLETQGFYIEDESPPDFKLEYDLEVELQSAKDYSFPYFNIPPREQWLRDNLPDIASTLASAVSMGGALRIAFKSDPKARRHILAVVRRLEGSLNHSITKDLESFGDEAFGGERSSGNISQEDAMRMKRRQREAESIRTRANQGTLACDVRAYGNSPHQIKTILDSLPFATNDFKREYKSRELLTAKTPSSSKNQEESSDMNPSREWGKSILKKALEISLPLALLIPLMWFGWWRPWTNIMSLTQWIPLIIALGASLGIFLLWRLKRPIVLSNPELSFLTSLPRRVRELPLEPGPEAPPSSKGEYSRMESELKESSEGGEYYE